MHDDQHGTAVVILAALTNALTVTGKRIEDIRVVVNGLGAAGTACCRMLLAAGLSHLIGCEPSGIVLRGDGQQLRACRTDLTPCMTIDHPQGTLRDALKGADVFIGLSVGYILTAEEKKKNRRLTVSSLPWPIPTLKLLVNWLLPTAGFLPPDGPTIRTKSTTRLHFPVFFAAHWMCKPVISTKR